MDDPMLLIMLIFALIFSFVLAIFLTNVSIKAIASWRTNQKISQLACSIFTGLFSFYIYSGLFIFFVHFYVWFF